MKLFKRLTALFVVMFAFVTVLAIANVEANDAAIYTATFDESGEYNPDSSKNDYTKGPKSYTVSDVAWSLSYAESAVSGKPLNGTGHIIARVAKNTTNNPVIQSALISASSVSKIEYSLNKNSGHTLVVEYSTDNSNWTKLDESTATTTSATNSTNSKSYTIYSYDVDLNNISGIYLKFTFSVSSSSGSNRDSNLDDIKIYGTANENLEQLVAPTNVVVTSTSVDEQKTVVSFNEVENASSYVVNFYKGDKIVKTANVSESGEEIDYYVPGTYSVSVQAVGDNVSYSNSEESEKSASFEIKAIEKTVAEISEILEEYVHNQTSTMYYRATGVVKKSGSNYYLTSEGVSLQLYKVGTSQTDSTNYTFTEGNVVTVESFITLYNSTKEFKYGYVVADLTGAALGYQVSELDAEANTVSLRLLAGLNAEYADVEALSLVIEGAKENDALKLTTVYDKIIADTENGIDEFTAEELGFKYLSALTITDVPTGAALTVTISYTTAAGTFQSVTKTYTVNADGTVTVA